MLKKISLPVQLLIVIAASFLLSHVVCMKTTQLFYTFSMFFKECLGFLLPFIIFSFITVGIISLKKNAPTILSILLGMIILSNSIVAFFSYFMTTTVLRFTSTNSATDPLHISQEIHSLLPFHLPKLINSEHAMLAAAICGLLLYFFPYQPAISAVLRAKKSVEWLINTIFIPVLPLYVFGFLLALHKQGIFLTLFASYGKTFGLIVCLQTLVIFLVFLVAAQGKLSQAITYIKNAASSYMTAFGTMSSTATIPVTSACAQKNGVSEPIALMATPITANIHLLGDAVATPTLALVTCYLFTGMIPTITMYAPFVMYFCINMLAVSGIPGGGIIVMAPLLVDFLGFNEVMISIITTLYLLQDSFGTAGNVMGDGALMIMVEKVLRRFQLID